MSSAVRTYDEEMKFIERITPYSWRIKKGFVPNMKVASFISILYYVTQL